MSPVLHFPVVIVGMGPGGGAASLFLSKNNIPHLIVDRATFPRDKVCGDALSGKVFSHLKHVDPGFHEWCRTHPDQFLPSYGVRFASPNGGILDVPFAPGLTTSDPAPGFISARMDFDQELARRVKDSLAEVWENCQLKNITKVNSGLLLHFQKEGEMIAVETPLLIGADGERGISRRFVTGQVQRPARQFSAGLRQYFEGVEGMHPMNFIELHFVPELLPGYFWVFPMSKGRANVGLGMLSSDVSKRKINLKKTLQMLVEEHPRFAPRFKNAKALESPQGWGLPLGNGPLICMDDHVLLVGDAASLIDPFTGEGIGNAILSGRYAAETAMKALEKNDYSKAMLSSYPKTIKQKIGQELQVSSILLKLVRYPFLFNWVVRKANRNKAFRDTISSMFADIDLRAKFSNPLFYIKLLFGGK